MNHEFVRRLLEIERRSVRLASSQDELRNKVTRNGGMLQGISSGISYRSDGFTPDPLYPFGQMKTLWVQPLWNEGDLPADPYPNVVPNAWPWYTGTGQTAWNMYNGKIIPCDYYYSWSGSTQNLDNTVYSGRATTRGTKYSAIPYEDQWVGTPHPWKLAYAQWRVTWDWSTATFSFPSSMVRVTGERGMTRVGYSWDGLAWRQGNPSTSYTNIGLYVTPDTLPYDQLAPQFQSDSGAVTVPATISVNYGIDGTQYYYNTSATGDLSKLPPILQGAAPGELRPAAPTAVTGTARGSIVIGWSNP